MSVVPFVCLFVCFCLFVADKNFEIMICRSTYSIRIVISKPCVIRPAVKRQGCGACVCPKLHFADTILKKAAALPSPLCFAIWEDRFRRRRP